MRHKVMRRHPIGIMTPKDVTGLFFEPVWSALKLKQQNSPSKMVINLTTELS